MISCYFNISHRRRTVTKELVLVLNCLSHHTGTAKISFYVHFRDFQIDIQMKLPATVYYGDFISFVLLPG